jgi:RNA polymerase sigma-70 factor, ECF subfamily
MKREREEPILQATALVHEVYLKLVDVQSVALEGKAHFFAICAQMMRRILVDAARKRAASRHGGGLGRIHLGDVAHLNLSQENDKQLIALDDALDELAQGDPRKAKVVELRYFGGLNVQDTAAVLKVSEETVTRDWRLARGWLLEIGPECVERRVLELAGMAADILRHSGATILYNDTNIVATHWPDRDAAELARKLQAQRIVVAVRHGNLRVSPHFYNTEADLELLRRAVVA